MTEEPRSPQDRADDEAAARRLAEGTPPSAQVGPLGQGASGQPGPSGEPDAPGEPRRMAHRSVLDGSSEPVPDAPQADADADAPSLAARLKASESMARLRNSTESARLRASAQFEKLKASAAAARAEQAEAEASGTSPHDPLRLCIYATVAALGWAFGPLALAVFAVLGFVAYWQAREAGLTRSACFLRDTRLVLVYLGVLAFAGLLGVGLWLFGWR